jgi:spore germination cell wall hydrolase CwlJ-like protein
MRLSKHIILYALTATVCLILVTMTVIAQPNYNKLFDIDYSQLTPESRKEIDCLADNIYHEAGYESEAGKVAVALVTLNRVNDPRYPQNICSVVKQKTKNSESGKTVCQFSWYCMNVINRRGSFVYEEARQVAMHVYSNYEKIHDITKGALFYHADYVNPRWKLQKTVVIGRHIFYKEHSNHDVKTKPTTERRGSESPFILSSDGRDISGNMQASY